MLSRRFSLILLGLVLLSVVTTRVVSAHATLVKADPAPNSILAAAPRQVTFWFDEPVDLTFSSAWVLDSHQVRVDNGDLTANPQDPKQLHLTVKPLANGVYTVVWKTLSASDGHVTRGVFAFSVGVTADGGALSPADAARGVSETNPIAVVTRTIFLWSVLALVGAFFFRELLLVRAPQSQDDSSSLDAPWRQLAAVALIAAAAAQLIWLALESSLVTGSVGSEGIAQVLFETRLGALWIVQLTFLAVFSFLIFRISPRVSALVSVSGTAALIGLYFGGLGNAFSLRTIEKIAEALAASWSAGGLFHHLAFFLLPAGTVFIVGAFQDPKTRRFISTLLTLGLLLTISLSGHAAARGDASLAVLADWIHLVSVALWVGGIATFAWILIWMRWRWPREARQEWLGWLMPRFSRLAIASVAAITVTGLYASLIQVASLNALWETLYGQVLSTKVALFIAMLALGAYNLLVIERALARRMQRIFRTTLVAEVALGAAVIALAGFLTLSVPARSEFAGTSDAAASSPISLVGNPAPDLKVSVTIPSRLDAPGTFDALVQGTDGQPAPNLLRVILEFTSLDHASGTTRVNLDAGSRGHYQASGTFLPLPGMWQLRVIVRRKGLDDVSVTFPLDRVSSR